MKAKIGHPPKRRNPNDATLRNVRAAAKRYKDLMVYLSILEQRLSNIEAMVKAPPFSVAQRQMGYKHSTSFPASIRVKG